MFNRAVILVVARNARIQQHSSPMWINGVVLRGILGVHGGTRLWDDREDWDGRRVAGNYRCLLRVSGDQLR